MDDTPVTREDVALIGMAGRFPGARNLDEFWRNIREGVESIRPFTMEELAASGIASEVLRDPNYVKAGTFLEGADEFAASFFGYTPREAELMDPQHRLFLECAWEALEQAGYAPDAFPGVIGVYGGVALNTYFQNNLVTRPELARLLGHYSMTLGNEKDFVATRAAYKLNLRGPAFTLQTACSTSLVAVHLACQALLGGECDLMLVGGGRVRVPLKAGYLCEEGGIPSPDGHCRAFAADAQGCVVGSGIAMVLLKRLSEAAADGDTIYAVIKGSAINNDGDRKAGFTAPSVEGQAAVIAQAHAMAGVTADTIHYVETHGTGTMLGDPIEVAGLTRAFRDTTDRTRFCALGALKPNIGHLDAGAGVAGLMKAALALHHREIPPSIHCETANPQIDFAHSPFYVNTRLAAWKAGPAPRRAGVSAFGIGGTNAHLVLEEAPPRESVSAERHPWQLLVLSTKTSTALPDAAARLAAHFRAHPEVSLADAAYTLQVGRSAFPHRRMLVCRGLEDAVRELEMTGSKRVLTATVEQAKPPVVFLFPGGGAQYVGMGRGLYETESVYRGAIDECLEPLMSELGFDLRELMFHGTENGARSKRDMESPSLALPALFATEYALARLLLFRGVTPAALIGHSMGEYVAACLAGVIDCQDGVALVTKRGRLFETLPPGGMLSVPLPEAELRPLLRDRLSLAAINGPSLCIISGPVEAIGALEKELSAREVDSTRIHISVAAHSAMLEPILADFESFCRTIAFQPPTLPFVSNLTGTWIKPEEATDPRYWVRHLRHSVRFSEGLACLLEDGNPVLLEIGPGRNLCSLARQQPVKPRTALTTLRHPKEEDSDVAFLLNTVGKLWLAGVPVDWTRLHQGETRRRIPLPTYPFERRRYWLDPGKALASQPPVRPTLPEAQTAVGAAPAVNQTTGPDRPPPSAPVSRKQRLLRVLQEMIQELSGLPEAEVTPHATFLEMGFDSLFLTQANMGIQKRFGVKITFRRLLEELTTLDAVAGFLDVTLAPEAFPDTTPALAPGDAAAQPAIPVSGALLADAGQSAAAVVDQLMRQLAGMNEQLARLRDWTAGHSTAPDAKGNVAAPSAVEAAFPGKKAATPVAPTSAVPAKFFGPFKPIDTGVDAGLDADQRHYLEGFIERYNRRTPESKRLTQQHRAHLADPRAILGFRRAWKELIYPVVAVRSEGARLWDVDGNEYVDLTMGFGTNLLGHRPPFVMQAVEAQLQQGVEIGPQTPLAGEVAELVCELTGMERAAFCNTGSEAVLAAIRLARTVTGRDKIAMFAGSYHGIFDEVLMRAIGKGQGRPRPVAPGILPSMAENMVVLEYDRPESLEFLRAHAEEFAAVLVEPVQSRHPELQPRAFLHALRALTEATGVALVFDEMITGFRCHPGGAQAWFGVRADIATYGKIIGGGLPIGIVTGRARFMDALDGGAWGYGDDSFPEVGLTYFAGTFVRHPLALAASRAVLQHLKASGPELQETLNNRTNHLVEGLNTSLEAIGAPLRLAHFSSWFFIHLAPELSCANLLFPHLRLRGIHLLEGRGCFVSTAHTEGDLQRFADAFMASVRELQEHRFLPVVHDMAPAGQVGEEKVTTRNAAAAEAPLTEGQAEIYAAARMNSEASRSYHEALILRLRGALDPDALRRAWGDLVMRHQALRATLRPGGEAQRFAPDPPLELTVAEADEGRLMEMLREETEADFDLVRGPLLRARLLRLGEAEHVFVLTVHHLVCDGFSLGILQDELAELYSAARRGKPADLAAPSAFSEFIEQFGGEEERAEAEAYWLQVLERKPPVLDFPTDRERPPVKTFRGATEGVEVDRATFQALKTLAAQHKSTMFSVLLAAFDVLLYRLSGQTDLVVGVPAAGQLLMDAGPLVGHCVNLLPLRIACRGDESFGDLLARVRGVVLDGYDHQNCTFGSLVRKLNLPRDPSRIPLVEVIFNVDRVGPPAEFHGLAVEPVSLERRFRNFDLSLNAAQSQDGLRVDFYFNTDLFDRETMRRWLGHYLTLLRGASAAPGEPLDRLPFLSEAERKQILVDWNKTDVTWPPGNLLHQLFEEQAARNPEATAVVFRNECLRYGALEDRANRLAGWLRQRGVGPDVLVGLFLERSVEMVVGLIATLKAGGAYLPLDPGYPRERLAFMVRDACPAVILTQRALEEEVPPTDAAVLALDAPEFAAGEGAAGTEALPAAAIEPHHLAYVIYTSGSTGWPKGVMIPHSAIVNHMRWMRRAFPWSGKDVVLQKTPFSFDASVWEFQAPLMLGGELVMAEPGGQADAVYLVRTIIERSVTTLQVVPSLLRLLLEEPGLGSCVSLRRVFCGGEILTSELQSRFFERLPWVDLHNLYGPTEAAIDATCWTCRREAAGGAVPIGRPIDNVRTYIVDSRDQATPVGIAGELLLGGAGLARGYLTRPELTAERFGPDPFQAKDGARVYRTGDRARYLPDGTIEFLGRMDRQVKLRGFRIELGEIEAVLERHPAVRAACVTVDGQTPEEQRLGAYIVLKEGEVDRLPEVREHASRQLPVHMAPSLFMVLERLPLTASGKVDRQALPPFEPVMFAAPADDTPSTELEKEIAALWAELLRSGPVGIRQNFFEVGGHSLLAIRLLSKLRELCHIEMPLRMFFQYPTVAGLAAYIETMRNAREGAGGSGSAGGSGVIAEEGEI